MMLLLKCPHCKNQMKYQSKEAITAGKRKQCVYCGHSFGINENILKRLE